MAVGNGSLREIANGLAFSGPADCVGRRILVFAVLVTGSAAGRVAATVVGRGSARLRLAARNCGRASRQRLHAGNQLFEPPKSIECCATDDAILATQVVVNEQLARVVPGE